MQHMFTSALDTVGKHALAVFVQALTGPLFQTYFTSRDVAELFTPLPLFLKKEIDSAALQTVIGFREGFKARDEFKCDSPLRKRVRPIFHPLAASESIVKTAIARNASKILRHYSLPNTRDSENVKSLRKALARVDNLQEIVDSYRTWTLINPDRL
jgi:hypothetical protein